MPMLNVGNAPRGEEYFGQEALLDELREKLSRGHVLLAGPRRFGKTGAMLALLDSPPEGYVPVYLNVEHLSDTREFMLEMVSGLAAHRRLRNLLERASGAFGKLWGSLRDLPEEVEAYGIKIKLRERLEKEPDSLAVGEEALALMADESAPVLLIIDEFPIMVDKIAQRDREEAHRLLHWLRRARQLPGTRTRFLVGGSIHLVPTLDAWGLADTVNDLAAVKVRVFDPQTTAPAFVRSVRDAYHLPLSDEMIPVLLEMVGTPIPFFLAVFLDSVITEHRRSLCAIDACMLSRVFEVEVIGCQTAQGFRHYRRRLDEHYPHPENAAALRLLDRMAREDGGADESDLFNLFLSAFNLPGGYDDQLRFLNMLGKLENDFYIERRDGRCRFFSRVLRLWWLRNHCLRTGG